LIHKWNPSNKSTGPKTKGGKMRSSQNARKHGGRSRKMIHFIREMNALLKEQREAVHSLSCQHEEDGKIL
jgi:hypothetical protein